MVLVDSSIGVIGRLFERSASCLSGAWGSIVTPPMLLRFDQARRRWRGPWFAPVALSSPIPQPCLQSPSSERNPMIKNQRLGVRRLLALAFLLAPIGGSRLSAEEVTLSLRSLD